MSYYNPVAPAGPRPRPGVVTMSGYLLYAVAALFTVNVIITLATINKTFNRVEEIIGNTDNSAASAFKAVEVVTVVLYLIVVALFVLLAIFVLRGNNGMRITTWVIAGIGVLCTLCSVASSGISESMTTSSNSTLTDAQIKALKDVSPAWERNTAVFIYVLIALALIAVIIMLAMPASNEFFRKPNLIAMPGYGAPGYGAPAYPTYGQQPPYPTAQQPPYPTAPDPSQPWAAPTQPPVNPQDPPQGPPFTS
jgi:hypothetical protein